MDNFLQKSLSTCISFCEQNFRRFDSAGFFFHPLSYTLSHKTHNSKTIWRDDKNSTFNFSSTFQLRVNFYYSKYDDLIESTFPKKKCPRFRINRFATWRFNCGVKFYNDQLRSFFPEQYRNSIACHTRIRFNVHNGASGSINLLILTKYSGNKSWSELLQKK